MLPEEDRTRPAEYVQQVENIFTKIFFKRMILWLEQLTFLISANFIQS